MRLDHLLSKETGRSKGCITVWLLRHHAEMGSMSKGKALRMGTAAWSGKTTEKRFWCRCAYGTHPFSSRTRWLRRKRPMILRWRRRGKAGGCRIPFKKKVERQKIEKSRSGKSAEARAAQLDLPVMQAQERVPEFGWLINQPQNVP